MTDHVTNGITNIHRIEVEAQLTKLQVITAPVLNFGLPVGDIISVAVMKDVLLNKRHPLTFWPTDESGHNTFVAFLRKRILFQTHLVQ
jgi:hypothetical protein